MRALPEDPPGTSQGRRILSLRLRGSPPTRIEPIGLAFPLPNHGVCQAQILTADRSSTQRAAVSIKPQVRIVVSRARSRFEPPGQAASYEFLEPRLTIAATGQ